MKELKEKMINELYQKAGGEQKYRCLLGLGIEKTHRIAELCAAVAEQHFNQWVSVSDKMPENEDLILIKNKHGRITSGFYAAKYGMPIPSDDSQEYDTEYNEATDEFYRVQGFYENPIEIPYTERVDDVTHYLLIKHLPPTEYTKTKVQTEPLTAEIFEEMGFTHRWPEYLNNPEYRRGDEHKDGKAYVIDMGCRVFVGHMLNGEDLQLDTKQDLINYLNNPNRHKG